MNKSIVKLFQVEDLKIPGARLITSPVYPDHRGTLYEAFHCLKIDFDCVVDTVTGIYPYKNQVYGPYSTSGTEVIYIIRGKLFCALVDKDNHENIQYLELVPGNIVQIPSGTIKAYLSLEEKTVFDVLRTDGNGHVTSYQLNDFKIDYPKTDGELTQAELIKNMSQEKQPRIDYLILGHETEIGASLVKEIEKNGNTWAPIRTRVDQPNAIKAEIETRDPAISVIVITGNNDDKWCNEHRVEVFDKNTTCIAAIARITRELKKHLTVFTSLSVFKKGDKPHNDEDKPDNLGGVRQQALGMLERLLSYAQALVLRAPDAFDSANEAKMAELALKLAAAGEKGAINWIASGENIYGAVPARLVAKFGEDVPKAE